MGSIIRKIRPNYTPQNGNRLSKNNGYLHPFVLRMEQAKNILYVCGIQEALYTLLYLYNLATTHEDIVDLELWIKFIDSDASGISINLVIFHIHTIRCISDACERSI